MLYIGITSPDILPNENQLIISALHSGLDFIHLRKPTMQISQMRSLIEGIDCAVRSRITLHDHFELALEYHLGGVHLNSRNKIAPNRFTGRISRSCHTIEELANNAHLEYCTLSPIFDSISKRDYISCFTSEKLLEAKNAGIINKHTIALGGISPDNIEQITQWGFGGVAILGYLWNKDSTPDSVSQQVKSIIGKIKI